MWMTWLQDGVLAEQNLDREQSAWESEVPWIEKKAEQKGSSLCNTLFRWREQGEVQQGILARN